MTAPVTRAEAEALCAAAEERAAKATPGPWRSTWDNPPREDDEEITVEAPEQTGPDRGVVSLLWYDGRHVGCTRENAAFIAAAREDVPALCAALREALAEADALRADYERQTQNAAEHAGMAERFLKRAKTAEAERDAAIARAERAEALLRGLQEAARAWDASMRGGFSTDAAAIRYALTRMSPGVRDVLRAALATLEEPPTGEERR